MMKKKNVKKKCITKMKFFQKRFSPNPTSSGCTAGCGCENTIRMLRKNNQNLARALSDQKIETDHWYSEVLGLKGELQELQEKLLRVPDNNMTMENVIGETEKQIKEYYDLIDKDFNSALDRIVQAVDKLTKVKQLVSGSQAACQGSSSFFTRTPGSRINLGSSGSLSSPRQRAVPPMVSGHVLQPAMVPLAKLKINFNDGRRHFLVGEDNDSNMPTIGEQPSPENREGSEEHQSPEVEEEDQENLITTSPEDAIDEHQSPGELTTTTTPTTPGEGTPNKNNNSRGKINSSPESEVTKAEGVRVSQNRSRRGRGRARGRRRTSIPRASKSSPSKGLGGGKEASPSTTFDDPLEGPSWLLDVGRLQFRSRGRRAKRQRQCTKFAGDVATLESSDEDIDESEDLSPKFMKNEFQRSKSRTRKKAALLANTPKFSPSLSLDHSCLDSPTSAPVKPETLKVKGNKRSVKSTNRKLIGKTDNLEAEEVSVIFEQDKELDAGIQNTDVEASPNELGVGVDSVRDSNKQVVCNGGSPEILTSESPPSPRDVDLTCKIVTNMDITMPVSNVVVNQEDPRTSVENNNVEVLQDDLKSTQLKKKFFKTREVEETCEEVPKKAERTPFDLSMLNETVGKMPPFSSTRTTEKENLPPLSPEINECGNLCDVSVVLEDVMKQQSVCSETPGEPPKLTPKESSGVKLMSSHSSRKLKSVSGTMQKAANHTEDSEEVKPKKFRKSQFDMLVASTSNPEHKTNKRSAKKTPNEDKHPNGKQESGGKKPRIMSDVTGKEDLEECFVLVHRTPIVENHTPKLEKKKTPRRNLKNSLSVLSDVQQEQQHSSENGISPQEQEEVDAVATKVIVDIPSSPINPNDNTERNTGDIENKEKECEENTQTGIRSEELEDCILLGDPVNEEHIEQDEDVHKEKSPDSEKQNIPGTPDKQSGFEGFEVLEKRSLALKPFTSKTVKSSKSKDVELIPTEDMSDEEILVKFCGKRRAALKISSLKEVSLNRKIRRGDNNEVVTSDSEGKDGRSISRPGPKRTKGKAKGRGRGKEKEKEMEIIKEKEKISDQCEVINIDL